MNTTVIGERLLQRRKELNLTLEDIAKRVGVTKSTIQRYEVGKISSPKIAVLKSIAYALETSYSWLIGETENHLPDNLYLSSPSNKQGVPIPVLGRVSAGMGIPAPDQIEGYIFEESSHINSGEQYAYLRVIGDSMYPEFKDGDFVLIKYCAEVENGSYAVVLIDDGDGVIKKIEYGKNKIILHSINPMYPPRVFEGPDLSRLRIFGTVCRLRREF